MVIGESGATGKLALHLVMVELKSENASVTALYPNMVEITVPLIGLQIPTPKNVTPIDAQVKFSAIVHTEDTILQDSLKCQNAI